MNPRQRLDLSVSEIDGELLILDRRDGNIHQLNAAASYIWEHCTGELSAGEIAAQLAADFDIARSRAEDDVAETLKRFCLLGLLAGL